VSSLSNETNKHINYFIKILLSNYLVNTFFLQFINNCSFLYLPYLLFYYYHWVDTFAGGLLVLEGIIHPAFTVSTLIQFTVPK